MISFLTGSVRFQLRAAAVIVREGSVLLHRAEGDAFWALPGGRVEPNEAAVDAVIRELNEELSVEVKPIRLIWIVENFFHHEGKSHHEVGLYFMAEPVSGCRLISEPGPYEGMEGSHRLEFDWFSSSRLASAEIRPSFLVRLLGEQDFSFQHVVHRDEWAPPSLSSYA